MKFNKNLLGTAPSSQLSEFRIKSSKYEMVLSNFQKETVFHKISIGITMFKWAFIFIP